MWKVILVVAIIGMLLVGVAGCVSPYSKSGQQLENSTDLKTPTKQLVKQIEIPMTPNEYTDEAAPPTSIWVLVKVNKALAFRDMGGSYRYFVTCKNNSATEDIMLSYNKEQVDATLLAAAQTIVDQKNNPPTKAPTEAEQKLADLTAIVTTKEAEVATLATNLTAKTIELEDTQIVLVSKSTELAATKEIIATKDVELSKSQIVVRQALEDLEKAKTLGDLKLMIEQMDRVIRLLSEVAK